jgi:hypothetical protein
MNEFSGPERKVDPQLLDRLVDGELPDGERRELLKTLERQSSWRQCALAFLEAQSWRDALFGYEGEAAEIAPPASASSQDVRERGDAAEPVQLAVTPPRDDQQSHGHFGHWRSWVGMAASFLLTLSLGMYIQHALHPNSAPAARGIDAGPVRNIGPGQAMPNTIVLPPQQDQGAESRTSAKPVVPDAVRQALEQSGYRIQQERIFVPMQLPNGQQVSVPIDRVNIVPADAPAQ